MRHHQRRGSRRLQHMQHLVADTFAKAAVQSGIGLVEQDHRGARCECTRQRHALLLAA